MGFAFYRRSGAGHSLFEGLEQIETRGLVSDMCREGWADCMFLTVLYTGVYWVLLKKKHKPKCCACRLFSIWLDFRPNSHSDLGTESADSALKSAWIPREKHPIQSDGNLRPSLYGVDFSDMDFAIRDVENAAWVLHRIVLHDFRMESASGKRMWIRPIE